MTTFLRLLCASVLITLAGCDTVPIRSAAAAAASPSDDLLALEPVIAPTPPIAPNVFDISRVEVSPAPLQRVAPHYPTDLRKAGIQGRVTILFTITAEGEVTDLLVTRANDIRFADAAKRAVAQWRFRPARNDGQPVACRLQVPIEFALSD